MQNENEKPTVTPENNQKKKGHFFKKVMLTLGLAGGVAAGVNGVGNAVEQEQRFPDGYRNVPKPELYMSAPNSVIPPADTNNAEAKLPDPIELTEPYVTATNSPVVEAAPTTTPVIDNEAQAISVDYKDLPANQQKQLDEHWQNFEKNHANDPEPTPNKALIDTSTTSGNYVEKN